MENTNTIYTIEQPANGFFTLKKDWFSFDKRIFFALICLFLFLSSYILNEFILTKDVYYRTYAEQVAVERIEELVDFISKWQWVGYVLIPVILAMKIAFSAVCLNIGTIFSGHRISFGKLFRIALIAESVFVLTTLTRNLYLLYFVDVNTMTDVQQFYPLSLMNLFNPADIPSWIIYPLQTINLFELAYVMVLATGLSLVLREKKEKMLGLVAGSYGTGLFIWMMFIVFMSINLS